MTFWAPANSFLHQHFYIITVFSFNNKYVTYKKNKKTCTHQSTETFGHWPSVSPPLCLLAYISTWLVSAACLCLSEPPPDRQHQPHKPIGTHKHCSSLFLCLCVCVCVTLHILNCAADSFSIGLLQVMKVQLTVLGASSSIQLHICEGRRPKGSATDKHTHLSLFSLSGCWLAFPVRWVL